MDDEIIYSWCFHDVECFDSTPSAAIIILDKDLESFSSLRSQQFDGMNGHACNLIVHEWNVFVNLINRLTNCHFNQLMDNPLVGYMEYDQLIPRMG